MLTKYEPKQRQQSGKAVAHNFYNRYKDESELLKPDRTSIQQESKELNEKYGLIVQSKHKQAHQNISGQQKESNAQYIRYTSKHQSVGTNSSARQRIIKMHQVQEDPLNPGGFKAKKVAGSVGSPPKTIMHSPPKKVTGQDMLDWKIPPCVSNWKNSKGYTIPLEMRLKADGRTLQQHTVNERHGELSNALYIAERMARENLNERKNLQKTMEHKSYLQKEEQMRLEAQKARQERNRLLEEKDDKKNSNSNKNSMQNRQDREISGKIGEVKNEEIDIDDNEDEEDVQLREQMRYAQKRNLEREQRLQYAGSKKTKQVRDQERDISEKVALGQAQANTGRREVQFDQRLFNQSGGLGSGFGDEDDNNLYDKPLFQDRTAASIYKNVRQDEEEDGRIKDGLQRILQNKKRGFESGENVGGSRSKPVEFEKHKDHAFQVEKIEKKVKMD